MNWNKLQEDTNAHQSEVDVAGLWAAIQPDVETLNKRRKKRRILWLWFLGSMLIGVGTLAYFYAINKSEKTDVISQNDNIEKGSNNRLQVDIEKEICLEDIEKGKSENSFGNLKNENQKDSQDNKVSKTDISRVIKNNRRSNNGVDSRSETNSSKLKKQNKGGEIIFSTLGEHSDVSKPQILQKNQKVESESPFPQSFSSLPILKPQIETDPDNDWLIKEAFAVLIDSIYKENLEEEEKRIEEKNTTKTPSRFSINAIGGLSYTFKKMSLIGEGSQEYLALRELSEKSLEASHIGLEFNYLTKKGGLWTTGFHQTTINEKFEYTTVSTVTEESDDIISFAVNFHQDTTFVNGTVIQTETTTHFRKYYNSYKMLEIPLLYGKQKQFNKWTIGGQAGLFVNLSLKTKGKILDQEEGDLVDLKNTDLFKSNVRASVYTGAFIQRALFSNLHLRFSVNGRYFLNDFARNGNPISQKYVLVGGNLGLGYSF